MSRKQRNKKQKNKQKPTTAFTETHDYSHEELIDNENLRQWLEDKKSRTKEVSVQPLFTPTNLDLKSKIGPATITTRLRPVTQLRDRGPLDPKMNELQPMVDRAKFREKAPLVMFSQVEIPDDKKTE